jgi:PAS domain S-box-containing protein
MTKESTSIEELGRENLLLRTRLEEATDVLRAIRTGEIDALVVEGTAGNQVYTLEGADRAYRSFVETMNEGAVTLSRDGTIVYCNRQFVDLVSTPLEQTIGTAFFNFVPPSDRMRLETLLAHGEDHGLRLELLLQQAHGTTIPVQLSARRLPEKAATYWCLIVTDLRDQKLQDALRESEDRLRTFAVNLERRVEERTRELVASRERLRALAHELNLTEQRERKRMARELHDYPAQLLALAIIKLSQIKQHQVQVQAPALTDLVHKVHELIVEALNYTRTLVTDLSPPMLEDIGFLSALRWLAEQMQRHQLTVTIEIPRGDDPKLPGEQALVLFQSIRELLINVSKHSGAGDATVTIYQHNGELRIDVGDRGRGFDVNTKAGGANGNNFGLFSIRERMQALGGTFELESSAEKGTRATLVLPLDGANAIGFRSKTLSSGLSESTNSDQPSERRTLPRNSAPAMSNSQQHPVRVMLVDDHVMVRQGLRSLLAGYADIEVVGEAANGEEALAGIVTQQPAIVVMDISMPKMNGIQATAAIRDRYPEIIVIGLSVQNGGEMQQAMLKAGAAVLLSKEDAVDQLYQTIQTLQTAIHT